MLAPADLKPALLKISPVSFAGSLFRRVPIVSLFGAKRHGGRLELTRIPPQFLYSGGSSGRINRFTYDQGPTTLYLAVDEETARAETADGLPLPPTAVYSAQAELRFILELTDSGVRARLGTTVKELTAPLLYKPGDAPLPTHVLAEATVASHKFSSIRYPRLAEDAAFVLLSSRKY